MRSASDARRRVADYASAYEAMIGFTPPRVTARLPLSQELDPELLELQEKMRRKAMYPDGMDQKTVQLVVWGILLGQLGQGARWHGIAARRAGASWEELHAVAALAYLFRGLPAMNLGAEILAELRADDPVSEDV